MELQRVAILDQIHRLTKDPRSDHSQDIQSLKSAYNKIVKDMRNDISAAPRDILDIFPPEVWIQIMKDALPVRGYSSALLLLNMVSNKWMQSLISVPTLWAYIDLRGSQEDSLATVEAFRWLSRDTPVHISIYVPTRHDNSMICAILMNIGPRLREVTIRLDTDAPYSDEETCVILQLVLAGSQFNSGVTHIHLERGTNFPMHNASTAESMKNNLLPPSLRAIRGWRFEWRDFQTKRDYLERIEAIDSCSPIEKVLCHRIQLPNLRSLRVSGYLSPSMKFNAEDEEGFPSLGNLTSLTYFGAHRDVLTRLLLSVAPQLVHLHLKITYTKIPLLVAALQATVKLRTLTIEAGETDNDERANERDVCPIYQHINGETHGLRDLTFNVGPSEEPPTPEQAEHRAPFLNFLMSTISALYTKVERLCLTIWAEYPIGLDAALSYVQSLPDLRTLDLSWPSGYLPDTQDTHTLSGLEYLNTIDTNVSHWPRTPNLLYLGFTWGCHGTLDTLTYPYLRRLCIDGTGSSIVELPESSFPSLHELHVQFSHGSFKLTSFSFLRSITITSTRYQPQGTMLCFALLNDPSMCPSLSEIKFLRCFPDWDILFLMLEKRNFMTNIRVSLIRRITIPLIPSGLCDPLASLLGGRYSERPSNNDLFMGGAQELLLDEQVLGCIECLLSMMGGCKCPARRAGPEGSFWSNLYAPVTGAGFAWKEIPEYGDPATVDWVVQRRLLFEEFVLNLAKWTKHYRREERCRRGEPEMEITECIAYYPVDNEHGKPTVRFLVHTDPGLYLGERPMRNKQHEPLAEDVHCM